VDTTDAREVLELLEALDAAGCPVWIAGGWGVDALVGRQTRPHRDLDVLVAADRLDATLAVLVARGYAVETDWLPVRVELHRPGAGRIDVHPAVFAADGSARQAGLDDTWFDYPADCFVHGLIGGVRVRCLSREQQVTFHTGYEPRDVDRHDLALLAQPDGDLT
jgi:lincosamide nucleotidyltransferase A/C/D/E